MGNAIVAAIDLSPVSDRVVDHAAALARALGVRLWIVHVAAPDPDLVGMEVGPSHVRDQRAAELRGEHVRIQELAARLQQDGLQAEALLVQGPTVETLIQELVRLDAGHLILGSHGRTGLLKVLMGSVCAQVLRDCPVPVTVIPTKR